MSWIVSLQLVEFNVDIEAAYLERRRAWARRTQTQMRAIDPQEDGHRQMGGKS